MYKPRVAPTPTLTPDEHDLELCKQLNNDLTLIKISITTALKNLLSCKASSKRLAIDVHHDYIKVVTGMKFIESSIRRFNQESHTFYIPLKDAKDTPACFNKLLHLAEIFIVTKIQTDLDGATVICLEDGYLASRASIFQPRFKKLIAKLLKRVNQDINYLENQVKQNKKEGEQG